MIRGLPKKRRALWRRGLLPAALALFGGAACGGQSAMDEGEKRQEIERLYSEVRERFPAVPEITAEELQRRLTAGEDLVLVDVRETEEQSVSILAGAMTLEDFERRWAENPEGFRDREVVTYCTIGYRSAEAAERLAATGVDVRNLAGSLLSWTHVGGELVTPEGERTPRLHVYGATWDLAADGYEGEW